MVDAEALIMALYQACPYKFRDGAANIGPSRVLESALHLGRDGGLAWSWIGRQSSRPGEIASGALDHREAMVLAPADW
ncbi:hypothetical protein PK98_14870 [Croceibacterium mercuriale]|uniref:Uncharacterized protein n=1 Tax=Croceibacterium mercuriale TaxID=1572751 RepID=A0A0B2BS98_9SPHN|nr:hypothetical protein [Croceibacterium mercuriale]KHL24254.1 hypothetical protein PK98_14870 [Croceibacterium mercuriale]